MRVVEGIIVLGFLFVGLVSLAEGQRRKSAPKPPEKKSVSAAKPLLRFDGLYQERVPQAGTSGSTYRNFFRFYPDGECITALIVADAAPEKIAVWFNRENEEKGKSEVSADKVQCAFQDGKFVSSFILNSKGLTHVGKDGNVSGAEYDFVPVAFPSERPQMDKIPPTRGNRAPVFPTPVELEINTNFEYDPAGRLMGGVTTIELKSPATDADGDPITYEWSGQDVIHTEGGSTARSRIKSDGLKATWRPLILMGELASAFLTLTAYDGKGGKAIHKFCIGNRVRC